MTKMFQRDIGDILKKYILQFIFLTIIFKFLPSQKILLSSSSYFIDVSVIGSSCLCTLQYFSNQISPFLFLSMMYHRLC